MSIVVLQTLNEDFFAVVDLQQADLPQARCARERQLPAPAAACSTSPLPAQS